MKFERVDHTAIAVHNLDRALARYCVLFGVQAEGRTVIADQDVEIAFLHLNDTAIELIQPLSANSGVARFLARRGEGLHHLGIAVDDIQAELNRLDAMGVELIDRHPRPGARGAIAFVHPRGTGGVLLELVERASL